MVLTSSNGNMLLLQAANKRGWKTTLNFFRALAVWILVFSLCKGWSYHVLFPLLKLWIFVVLRWIHVKLTKTVLLVAIWTLLTCLCQWLLKLSNSQPDHTHKFLKNRSAKFKAQLWFSSFLDLGSSGSHFLDSTVMFSKITYLFGSAFSVGELFCNKLFHQYWRHIPAVIFEQTI